MSRNQELVDFAQHGLSGAADPAKAAPMAAYMKTDMPFYGVQKPERARLFREVKRRFPPASRRGYESAVRALWRLPHREEKYLALDYATTFLNKGGLDSIRLYQRLVREGAWWDLVDPIAAWIASPLLRDTRAEMQPVVERWIDHDDLWLRRTALLSQLRHKEQTDEQQLYDFCLRRADEKEFFIRKAIGWALRDYSWTAPRSVEQFLREHGERLSGLSRREAAKRLRPSRAG